MQHWIRSVLEDALRGHPPVSDTLKRDLGRIVGIVEAMDVHAFRQPELEHLCDQLSECIEIDVLSDLLGHAAELCGFLHASVFILTEGESIAFRTRVCTTFPVTWLETYGARNYQFVDPVVARAIGDNGPFRFSDIADELPMTRSFWKDAERHGIGRDGICVAFDMPGGVRVGVSFTTDQDSECVSDLIRLNGLDAVCLARAAADAFVSLARVTPATPDCLTSGELRFLRRLVTGGDPETGPIAEQDATSICTKLGVGSVLQAVAVASANRWFDELPFEMADVSIAAPGSRDLEPDDAEAEYG